LTTIVRPSEADLSAIARRINGPLSPEGAESWYRNDATTLLQEVALLRQEARVARSSFYEDGAQAEPNASLFEWAQAWKAQATGFWEKAQTRSLREQLATQRIQTANLKDALVAAGDSIRQHLEEKDALAAELAEVRAALAKTIADNQEHVAGYLRRIAELDELLAQAKNEVAQVRNDAAVRIEQLALQNEERLARTRDLMRNALDSF
jgi:chromosome segregation ATPase